LTSPPGWVVKVVIAVAIAISLGVLLPDAVDAKKVSDSYYVAVAALLPLLLIALLTGLGRRRELLADLRREIDSLEEDMRSNPEPDEPDIGELWRGLDTRGREAAEAVILATLLTTVGEFAALDALAVRSTTLTFGITAIVSAGFFVLLGADEAREFRRATRRPARP
jgi:hypothetical protein